MVLSFAAAGLAELYGVFGTVVVAGVAVGAVAVPARTAVVHAYVVQGTHLGTVSARDAVVGGEKRLVGNPAVEVLSNNVGLETRKQSSFHARNVLSRLNGAGHLGQTFPGLGHLALGHTLGVEFHDGHIDICVGHYDAEGGVQRQADGFQLVAEHFFRHSHIVAAGSNSPCVRHRAAEPQLGHEFGDQMRRPPRIDWEHKAHGLALGQCVLILPCPLGIGDEHQSFVQLARQTFGNETAVATTGEVENHIAVFFFAKIHIFFVNLQSRFKHIYKLKNITIMGAFIIILVLLIVVLLIIKSIKGKKASKKRISIHSPEGIKFWVYIDNILQNQHSETSLLIYDIPVNDDATSLLEVTLDLGNGNIAKVPGVEIKLTSTAKYFTINASGKKPVLKSTSSFVEQAEVKCAGVKPEIDSYEEYVPQPTPRKKTAAKKTSTAKPKAEQKTTEKKAPVFCTDRQFNNILKELENDYIDSRRVETMKKHIAKKNLHVSQLIELVKELNTDRHRLEVLEFAYPYSKEKRYFAQATSALDYTSNQNELLEFIGKKK